MSTLGGFPYTEITFDADGTRLDAGPLASPGATDLIVVSHGWHQDADNARGMYERMLKHLRHEADAAGRLAGRTVAVAGVFWPSDKFKDNLGLEDVPNDAADKPGVAIGAESDVTPEDVSEMAGTVARLIGMSESDLSVLALKGRHGGANADKLVAKIREHLPDGDEVDDLTLEEHASLLDRRVPGSALLEAIRSGGPTGGGASLGDPSDFGDVAHSQAPAVNILGGPFAVVAKLLNQVAYFQLKRRAGRIGESLANLIDADGLPGVQRLHLVGHSFGARLVTAAAARMTRKPYSLTLLQGAFSHNSLGLDIPKDDQRIAGTFRKVVAEPKVEKRIVITHTWNDHAVGIAYAIASRASNTVASGFMKVTPEFGGERDLHGGIGANGALRLKPGEGASQTPTGDAPPQLDGHLVHSLHCDFIKNHTNIDTAPVARVLLAAID
jgi:hypothetical protein